MKQLSLKLLIGVLLYSYLLSFVCRTKESSKEKPTARQNPSARPCVSMETPARIRRFPLDSAAAENMAFPCTPRGARSPPLRWHDDFCIYHRDALRSDEDGIAIQLQYLLAFVHEFGYSNNCPCQRIDITPRLSPHTEQQFPTLQFREHPVRLFFVDRCNAEDRIVEQFRVDTAEADHDHRTEGEILETADDEFVTGWQMFLNQN